MEKLAFLFTGQGSQYVGMGKSLYNQHEIVRKTFEEANEVLGYNLSEICFEGTLSQLTKPEVIQPALLTLNVANYRVYMEQVGIAPHFLAGHSFGEYAALVCAGAISFSDCLRLVKYRGELTKLILETNDGAMTIIDGLPVDVLKEECKKLSNEDQFVMINSLNSPSQFGIAGHQDIVEEFEGIMLEKGAQITPLLGNAPLHTPLMQEIVDKFSTFIDSIQFYSFRVPVISNVTAKPYGTIENIKDLLINQLIKPVRWIETMEFLKRYGVTHAIEMGPQNILGNLVSANTPSIVALCYSVKDDQKTINNLFPSNHHLRRHIPTVVTRCLAIAVATPNLNYDEEEYRKGVIEPYREIQNLQELIESENRQPTIDEMRKTLDLLQTVFDTKKVSIEEQNEWKHHILHETGTYYLLKEKQVQTK